MTDEYTNYQFPMVIDRMPRYISIKEQFLYRLNQTDTEQIVGRYFPTCRVRTTPIFTAGRKECWLIQIKITGTGTDMSFSRTLFHQGNLESYPCSPAFLCFNFEFSANGAGPFLHTYQTQRLVVRQFLLFHAFAIIFYRQH